ncbi:hypothetical protein Q7P36_006053 [Cladosporium allicinum]
MKLLSTTTLLLTSLFTTTTLANPNFSIKFEPLPSTVAAGTTYNVKWTTNQDFVIDDFLLVHRPSNTDNGWEPVRKVTNNFVNTTAGAQSTSWKVPALKDDGYYALWLSASPAGEEDHLPRSSSNRTGFAALTNWVEIEGGPVLYPKEIAGVVVGSVAFCALVVAAIVFVPRCIRKRRSVAVDLS